VFKLFVFLLYNTALEQLKTLLGHDHIAYININPL